MATPTQLSAPEQDTLVKQIGLALLRSAPRDWKRISATYRTVGRYHELDGEITLEDGSSADWVATHDIATLFGRLRSGMYRAERGTWFNASYALEAPASYNLEYDREEPEWHLLPPSQAYADELRMFPRSDENVPEWLMRRLAGLGPERPGPRLRIARVFDRTDEGGRPVIDRPELDADEQEQVLDYLAAAPVVRPGRGFDIDRLAETPEPAVPVGFHSDGIWIWPAAVSYYLQEYGLAPDQELLEHIRAKDYQVPEVSAEQQEAAADYLTRGNAVPPQPSAIGAPPMPRGMGRPEPAMAAMNGIEATQAWQPPPPEPPAAEPAQSGVSTQYFNPITDDDDADDQPPPAGQPQAEEPVLERLHAQLDELGVPATEYRIGGPTKLGWSLEQVPEGWRVGWYEDSLTDSSVFGDADDAAAFMLGKVMLEPNGRVAPAPQEPTAGKHEASRADAEETLTPLPDVGRHEAVPVDEEPELFTHEQPEPPEPPAEPEPEPEPEQLAEFKPPEEPEALEPATKPEVAPVAAPELPAELEPAEATAEAAAEPAEKEPAEEFEPPLDEDPEALATTPELPEPELPEPPLVPVTDEEPPPAPAGLGRPAPVPTEPHHVPPPLPAAETPQAPPAAAARPPRPAVQPSLGGAPSAPGTWPIQPTPGEPPLTLFRGKQLVELPAGSELDRFGGPEGNLTYVAETRYEQRSLVPEWINRPYHMYRVQQPIEALTGVAIPWFNQPGGGTAFILPAPIGELLADGVLVELEPGELPID